MNSPYEYPSQHWELDKDGQPTQRVLEGRRRAEFMATTPKSRPEALLSTIRTPRIAQRRPIPRGAVATRLHEVPLHARRPRADDALSHD
ncbi:hypothetical protein D1Y84_09395 [Acidipila sp. EB88]|nr:hypothetical protein D1Y84_09395 [Acidipila sp. EB88]